MTTSRSTVAESLRRLEREVSAWPGVEVRHHRTGCTQFRSPHGEVGHLHRGGLLDVPFPRELRDRLVSKGQARPHHVMPASGWVSYQVSGEKELPGALALLRLSYECHGLAGAPQPAGPVAQTPQGPQID
ncbi:luciferase family protein [Deinococcus peraridilitoris]|uniref:Luciferase domain-containing protein n=1 Tax=Deinococcus peraridilitoris (strain DSM 19664 / LMG 22246 / CIP 109416 / KR-200) TaxID=937777 RepID=K9ZY22_DEIPD|nr:luciferase family protein [Deinococcus peraridilitoris]AFZ65827.1 hypothetical protein Deipe_0224 [Deinococcus peraridilitoris DSM 19664]